MGIGGIQPIVRFVIVWISMRLKREDDTMDVGPCGSSRSHRWCAVAISFRLLFRIIEAVTHTPVIRKKRKEEKDETEWREELRGSN